MEGRPLWRLSKGGSGYLPDDYPQAWVFKGEVFVQWGLWYSDNSSMTPNNYTTAKCWHITYWPDLRGGKQRIHSVFQALLLRRHGS